MKNIKNLALLGLCVSYVSFTMCTNMQPCYESALEMYKAEKEECMKLITEGKKELLLGIDVFLLGCTTCPGLASSICIGIGVRDICQSSYQIYHNKKMLPALIERIKYEEKKLSSIVKIKHSSLNDKFAQFMETHF